MTASASGSRSATVTPRRRATRSTSRASTSVPSTSVAWGWTPSATRSCPDPGRSAGAVAREQTRDLLVRGLGAALIDLPPAAEVASHVRADELVDALGVGGPLVRGPGHRPDAPREP